MEQEESRKVRNRDIPLLTKIFYILKEAESVERRGEWTYERLFNITRRMTGMPIGGGNAPGMDGTLAEVEELNRIYGERLQECVHALKASGWICEDSSCGGGTWENCTRSKQRPVQLSMLPQKQKYPEGMKKQRWCKYLNESAGSLRREPGSVQGVSGTRA